MIYSLLKPENLSHTNEYYKEFRSFLGMPMVNEFRDNEYKKIVEKVKETYDSLADVFDYFYPAITLNTNNFIQNLHKFLQKHAVKKILDCACGTGRELIPLAETRAYELIIGSDLSAKMLEKASKKAKGLAIDWIQSEWLELPQKLQYNNFDAILCVGNPLTHIPPWSYVKVFSSIFQLLRNGGIFIVNERNWESELGKENFKKGRSLTTVYAPLPRLSFLNVHQTGQKEIFAYFTYHLYDARARIQLLHFLEVNTDGVALERLFQFKCFYVGKEAVKNALVEAGSKKVEELNCLNKLNDFDTYAEEMFLSAWR